jgi:hypothetical protein
MAGSLGGCLADSKGAVDHESEHCSTASLKCLGGLSSAGADQLALTLFLNEHPIPSRFSSIAAREFEMYATF